MGNNKLTELGNYLSSRRVELDMTIAQLAKALGLQSYSCISSWENGRRLFPAKFLPKLCQLGFDVDRLKKFYIEIKYSELEVSDD